MKLKIALPCLLAANLLLAVPVSSFAERTPIVKKDCVALCIKEEQCGGKLKNIKTCLVTVDGPKCGCTEAYKARQQFKTNDTRIDKVEKKIKSNHPGIGN